MARAKTFPNCSWTLGFSVLLCRECTRPDSNLSLKFTQCHNLTVDKCHLLSMAPDYRLKPVSICYQNTIASPSQQIGSLWVAEAGLQKKNQPTTPSKSWKQKMPRGTGPLTVRKRNYKYLQIQWQCFTCRFLSLMSSFTKPDFSLLYPLPSMQEWKQKLASLAHKRPPKQAQVHFSKVTAFTSLSVDMNMISRLMLSTHKLMDGASTPQ